VADAILRVPHQVNVKVGPDVVRLTPFYLACMHGHHAIVEYFLETYVCFAVRAVFYQL
jgi:hypothetical protein